MESNHLRMDKYYEISEADNKLGKKEMPSRLKRNQELYRKVSTLDIEDFDVNSNISVLGDNTKNIDIEKIQDALKEKYHEAPRKKSFGDTDEINLPPIKLDETREYDINVILEKAKEAHEVDYEKERLKKARSTQEILDGLESYSKKDKNIEDSLGIKDNDKDEINTLIDTINAKELIENEGTMEVSGEMDPLDLLSDLKGDDDNTKVLGALVDEVTAEMPEVEEDTDVLTKDDLVKIGEEIEDEEEPEEEEESEDLEDTEETEDIKTEEIDKAFADTVTEPLGNKKVMAQSDFEDFDDLREEMDFTKVIIRVLVVLIILVFIAALVVLANKYLNLGLF